MDPECGPHGREAGEPHLAPGRTAPPVGGRSEGKPSLCDRLHSGLPTGDGAGWSKVTTARLRAPASRGGLLDECARSGAVAVRHHHRLPLPVRPPHHRDVASSSRSCRPRGSAPATRSGSRPPSSSASCSSSTSRWASSPASSRSSSSAWRGATTPASSATSSARRSPSRRSRRSSSSRRSSGCGSSAGTACRAACTSPRSGCAAFGTMLSAYFILAANSFMQHPTGYVINPETKRAEPRRLRCRALPEHDGRDVLPRHRVGVPRLRHHARRRQPLADDEEPVRRRHARDAARSASSRRSSPASP